MTGGEGGDDRQKQKDKTLDPRLLMSRMTEGEKVEDDRMGAKARMTEGEKARMTEWGGGEDDRKRKASGMTEGKNGDDGGKELLDEAA